VWAIHLDDWLISTATGKQKVAFDFLKTPNQQRGSSRCERYFTSGRLGLSKRVEDIPALKMNILAAYAADFTSESKVSNVKAWSVS
jgi:hypothetical protein